MSPPLGPSIVGGAQLYLTLDSRELALAHQAIGVIGNGYSKEYIDHSLGIPPVNGQFNVYNPDPASGDTANLPSGGQVLAAYGYGNVDLNGRDQLEVLIGNSGKDRINAAGGNGTIVAGPGQDTITMNSPHQAGGNMSIYTGPSADVIDMWGGHATVYDAAWSNTAVGDYVNLWSGDNTVVGADLYFNILGGDNYLDITDKSSVQFDGNSTDRVIMEASAKPSHLFFEGGTTKVNVTGQSGDRIWTFAGQNQINEKSTATVNPVSFNLIGGVNQITTLGLSQFDIVGGSNSVTVGGSATFYEKGGHNSVALGAGQNDTFTVVGGHSQITLAKDDTVNVIGGASTITEAAGATLNISGGGNDVVNGNGTISVTGNGTQVSVNGNDTITFGSGADTMVEHGTATVFSGAGGITVKGGLGTTSIAAGSGNATLIGGSGNDTFAGGSGMTSMVGGTATNLFIGGTGQDEMTGNGVANVYLFNSAFSGGSHVIENFNPTTDHIHLIGYSVGTALADAHVVGGNTVITLDGGHTTITLDGYTHLNANNFT